MIESYFFFNLFKSKFAKFVLHVRNAIIHVKVMAALNMWSLDVDAPFTLDNQVRCTLTIELQKTQEEVLLYFWFSLQLSRMLINLLINLLKQLTTISKRLSSVQIPFKIQIFFFRLRLVHQFHK